MKKIVKLLSAFFALIVVLSSLLPCVAAIEDPAIDWSLLNTEVHPNVSKSVETRQERHERLISEGYELQELKVVNRTRNLYITGPDGNLYETRVSTSTYRQPNRTSVKYGEKFLNIITQSNTERVISFALDFALSYVDSVGWIPSLLGINVQSLADFISRGRITYIMDSTQFYYDIEVKLAGTNRYYFVASAEKFEVAVTATSSGFTQLGTPVQETVQGFKSTKSANYEKEQALSNIAVDCFVTGGEYGDYVYFEEYAPITYIYLS